MDIETDDEKSERLRRILEKAKELYTRKSEIWCPYFAANIALTSDGFNHLQYKPNRSLRNINEQIYKLSLVGRALEIIKKAGTLQEYRETYEKTGAVGKDGFSKTSRVQYWGFHGILGIARKVKVVAVIKKVGDGKLMFWSTLLDKKFKNHNLLLEDIEEK